MVRPNGDLVARERLSALMGELTQARYRCGDLPQTLLATRLGVAAGSVMDWEAGRDHPSAPHLVLWARELRLRLVLTDRAGTRIRVTSSWRARHSDPAQPFAWRELYRLCAGLRAVRMSRGLSQTDVAGALGVDRRSVTRWECAQG